MDSGLLKELGLVNVDNLRAIEYAQECVVFYEQTMRAMGLFPPETISRVADNSQVTYMNPAGIGDEYANIPEHY